MTPVRDRDAMIAGMAPELLPGRFVFVTATDALAERALPEAIATMREAEGLSLILPEPEAEALGLAGPAPMRQITLTVHSDLEGVGLTAAVSTALSDAGIACNVVAGARHDHLFVPAERADEALALLRALQANAAHG